jgi:3-(3-hydroxy-phenyl)propionate hydroxylase
VPLQVVAVGACQPVAGADTTLADSDGQVRLRHGLQAGGAYLLRPDQHVCARWTALDATRLRAALLNAVGLNTEART